VQLARDAARAQQLEAAPCARAPLPGTHVRRSCSSNPAFTSIATQSTSGSTSARRRGTMPAVCRPTRNPIAFTSRIAAASPDCCVGSPPLKTTASSSPRRRSRKASTAGQGISASLRVGRSSGLWQ